jgi:hypothetical protein
LLSLLAIPFLPFIVFSFTLCKLFLLLQCALSVLFFEVLALSVEGRGAMRRIVHRNNLKDFTDTIFDKSSHTRITLEDDR